LLFVRLSHVGSAIWQVVELGAVGEGVCVIFGARKRRWIQWADTLELGRRGMSESFVGSIVGLSEAIAAVHTSNSSGGWSNGHAFHFFHLNV